jgi:hypothetical protein
MLALAGWFHSPFPYLKNAGAFLFSKKGHTSRPDYLLFVFSAISY